MSFARLLSEAIAADGLPRTGDVLAVGLPLLRDLAELHESGSTSGLTSVEGVHYDGTALRLVDLGGNPPVRNDSAMRTHNPSATASGIEVRARHLVDSVVGEAQAWRSGDVHRSDAAPERPMLMIGYRAWEQEHRHHDALTDSHLAGLLLVSFATGLDLDNEADVDTLAAHRGHLTRLNPGLHPVVANVLSEMVDPDRHGRPPEVDQVITRLEHHRELPDDLDLTGAYTDPVDWRHGVLSTLRDRVFDTTRRNRALYFRPTAATVSLTEASVPLLLNVERIRPDDLFTWTSSAATTLIKGSAVDLDRWCRFEDAPHLAPALDKLISNERRTRNEVGHGSLRLIVAFLRWFDPRADEVVHSPLLMLPVELTRRKGVTRRYRLQVDGAAQVNPILRFVFDDRFGISLPESIDPDLETIRTFVADLERQVRASAPAVSVEIIERPRIDLLRRKAQLRVDTYRRRRARTQASSGRWRRTNHSYDRDDWRPLGLALYRRFVESPELPLRGLAGAPARPRSAPPAFTDTASADAEPSGPASERSAESYAVAGADVHRDRWEVDLCSVTLAALGSRRTSLSRDYEDLLDRLDAGDRFADSPFEQMFTPEVSSDRPPDAEPISIDQPLVLPADDAQARAVRRAMRGDSFIIQGPPGTGKSQTITNVIAGLVAQGKRVLFVCEKRAALDVVGHRLRQVGLGDLVATIHDSQLDRKSFVMELGETYREWLDGGRSNATDRRQALLAEVADTLRPLDFLIRDLGRPQLGSFSVSDLVERSVLMRAQGIEASAAALPDASLADWFEARPALDAARAGLVNAGLAPALGAHPALRLHPREAAQPDPVVTAAALGRDLESALADLRQGWSSGSASSSGDTDIDSVAIRDLVALRQLGDAALDTAGSPGFEALNPIGRRHDELRQASVEFGQLERAVAESAGLDGWRTPLPAVDARAGLTQAAEHETSMFRFFSGRWRQLKSTVTDAYDFDQHSVPPTITSVLSALVDHYDRVDNLDQARQHSRSEWGVEDPRTIVDLVDRHRANPVFAGLVPPGATGVDVAFRLEAIGRAATLCDRLVVTDDDTVADAIKVASGLRATSVAHEAALVAWGGSAEVAESILAWVIASGDDIGPLELGLIDDGVQGLLTNAGATLRGGAEIDSLVASLLDRYQALLGVNAAVARGVTSDRFLDHVAHSEASMAGRSDEDKAFKRSYNAGRRVLEREFNKKMRYRSIRELSDGDSGLVVRDLRPIWLMSPLSVSDTLPLDDAMFDAVVFDEASQIPVEDAIPSTFRSRQVVVVGDRMQLPPTRFFSANSDLDEVEVTDDDHSVTIALDADSFLTQADQTLSSTMLTWHYRSRAESLIAYSNHAFYDGDLATVPDRTRDDERCTEIVVDSPDEAETTVDDLLSRPLSFHRVSGGVYRNRANAAEADYIAELTRALLRLDTGLTIGIVAFSEAQQGAIDTALDELATLDRAFGERLEAERHRIDDGEYLGLFVKNLENVQGDERDIVILSVCYAPAEDGRMRMNFGPINQAGGERRLNVIFSRAKQHMAVVSSIEGHQITNTHNDGAAHLANFLHYAAAESVGDTGQSDAVLAALRGGRAASTSTPARTALSTAIARELERGGHRVDVGVGRSRFTLDVAIRSDDGYRLGIVIDPADTDVAASRFVAEAGVLAAFGWPVLRVTPAEWWAAPARVVERIEHRLSTLG